MWHRVEGARAKWYIYSTYNVKRTLYIRVDAVLRESTKKRSRREHTEADRSRELVRVSVCSPDIIIIITRKIFECGAPSVCVSVWVCACVREAERDLYAESIGKKRERKKEKRSSAREREREIENSKFSINTALEVSYRNSCCAIVHIKERKREREREEEEAVMILAKMEEREVFPDCTRAIPSPNLFYSFAIEDVFGLVLPSVTLCDLWGSIVRRTLHSSSFDVWRYFFFFL